MIYKWSTETFRKTETLSDGQHHEYSGERYWIDINTSSGVKLDVVLKKVACDDGAPVVSGKFRVNNLVLKEWKAATIQEAADIGEKLIEELKTSLSDIS